MIWGEFLQDAKMSFTKSAQFLKMENYNLYIFPNNKENMEIHLKFCQIFTTSNLNIAVTQFWSWLQTIYFSQILNETGLNHYLKTVKMNTTVKFPLNL